MTRRDLILAVVAIALAGDALPPIVAQFPASSCAALVQRSELADAERCARDVLGSDPRNALAYEVVGAVRLRENDYAMGERMLREAIRLEPGLVGARLDLANTLALQGRYFEAEMVFRDARRLAPGNLEIAFALVRVENAEGHYRQSLEEAQPFVAKLTRQEDGLTVLISDALGLRDDKIVTHYLEDWSALKQTSLNASVVLAEMLAAKNHEADAIKVASSAARRDPDQFEIHFLLGELYVKTNSPQKAREEYETGLAIRGDCTRCLLALGRLTDEDGEHAKAKELLLHAQMLSPDDPDILTALGKVCLEMDQPEEAIQSLSKAAKLHPDNDTTQYLLASAYTSNKDYPDSLAILTRLDARHPSEPLFPYSLGAVFYLSGDYPAAETQLRKSLMLNPKGVGALYYLGLTLRKQERLAEAEKTFHELLGASGQQHAPGLEALGELLMTERRYAEAKSALEQAVRIDPSFTEAHYVLGRTLARLGMRDASQREFATVETLNQMN